jgi:hypothetical protein
MAPATLQCKKRSRAVYVYFNNDMKVARPSIPKEADDARPGDPEVANFQQSGEIHPDCAAEILQLSLTDRS